MPVMPTFYIPHGAGPCFFMDWQPAHTWQKMERFLKNIFETLPHRPKAIVVISAHWCTAGFHVTSGTNPNLIFDYYGFPAHTYELKYPAPGDSALAKRIQQLLAQEHWPCLLDPHRGFDHGLFIPLKLIAPEGNIPVVQLSLDQRLDAKQHMQLGALLAPLRHEGVLILGSGMSFHNMRGYGDPAFTSISEDFDQWLRQAVESVSTLRETLVTHWAEAPYAHQCHPVRAEEHLLPLMVVAGAAEQDSGQRVFHERILETALSGFRFGLH